MNLHKNNWTLRFLVGKEKINILRFTLIIFAWFCSATFCCWIDDSLYISGKPIGLFEDHFMIALFLVFISVIYGLKYLFSKTEIVFKHMPFFVKNKEEVKIKIKEAIRFIRLETRASKVLYISLISIYITLVYLFQIHLPLFTNQSNIAWSVMPYEHIVCWIFGIFWAVFYCVFIFANISFYLIAIGLKVFGAVYVFAKKDEIITPPMVTQNINRLSSLGNLSYSLSLVVSTGLILVVVWMLEYGIDQRFLIPITLYLTFLLFVFFAPLMSVHYSMKRTRNKYLNRYAIIFNKYFEEMPIPNDLLTANSDRTNLRTKLSEMYWTSQLFSRIERMPVWPLKFDTVRKILSIVIIPIIIYFVQLFTDNKLVDFLMLTFLNH